MNERTPTTSAIATTSQGSVTGTRITYSNDPENPDGYARFMRELERMVTEPATDQPETGGFADPDPYRSNLRANRKREREELNRNRDYLRSDRIPERSVSRTDGSVVANPTPIETDGVHNPTRSVSVGIGNVPVATIGEWVSESIPGYGFSVREQVGYWEGIPERSVSIVFQGTRANFDRIVSALSRNLPFERFAHVETFEPVVEYVSMERVRVGVSA